MDALSRRLESAIRQLDRRLRDGGDDNQYALEAAREELNAVLDEAAYPRRSMVSPNASGLRSSIRRLSQTERSLDASQLSALQDEIRWIDEEGSQARKELEDRIESRIVAVEARMTALVAVNNETESRLRELERRTEMQETMAKRTRMTIEELADKVSQAVNDLQQRLLAVDERAVSLLHRSLPAPAPAPPSIQAAPLYRELHRPIQARQPPSKSEAMMKELLNRIESLENELAGERERSIKAVELVANALTPTRRSGGTTTTSPPERERGGAATNSSSSRRYSASAAASRRATGSEDDHHGRNGDLPPPSSSSSSKRYYQ